MELNTNNIHLGITLFLVVYVLFVLKGCGCGDKLEHMAEGWKDIYITNKLIIDELEVKKSAKIGGEVRSGKLFANDLIKCVSSKDKSST